MKQKQPTKAEALKRASDLEVINLELRDYINDLINSGLWAC